MTHQRCMACFNFTEYCVCAAEPIRGLKVFWVSNGISRDTTPRAPLTDNPLDARYNHDLPPIELDEAIAERAHELAGAEGKPTIPEVIDLFRHFVALDGNGRRQPAHHHRGHEHR